EAAASAARSLGLGAFILLSKGEDEAKGRENLTALGDVMEALLGAIYQDGGLEPAEALAVRLWEPLLAQDLSPPRDAKTSLQEWSQARSLGLPVYTVLSQSGPAHDPKFTIRARIGDKESVGEGSSKRAAEQMAAKLLLESIEND
ncbi:MAG: ribonuclease III, partial [Rhodospirillales bacterium]